MTRLVLYITKAMLLGAIIGAGAAVAIGAAVPAGALIGAILGMGIASRVAVHGAALTYQNPPAHVADAMDKQKTKD